MASSRRAPAAEQLRDGEFDPVYEWLDDGGSYLLRLSLPGFKKEDFKVHVDGAGRLTVISQGGARRLHKAFQLPNTADLEGITGRFDGAVLTLTVPKLRQPDGAVVLAEANEEQAAAGEPKDLQEDKTAAAPKVGDAEKPSLMPRGKKDVEDERKAEVAPPLPGKKVNGDRQDQDEKARAEHKAHVASEATRRIEAARAKVAEARAAAERTGGQWKDKTAAPTEVGNAEKPSSTPKGKAEVEEKRKVDAAPPLPGEKANGDRQDQDDKARAEPEQHRAYVAREATRRIEAARAKMAEARAAPERTGGQWKERAVAGGYKWAETIGQKKEVIATAVAAFTLGVFVSQAFGRR